MGSTLSEEVSGGDYPTTGKEIVVKVQCSHNGMCLCFSEHRGHRVTSDWTAAQLQEVIQVRAGVHRHCQRLMFGGRVMEKHMKIASMLGCRPEHVPDRMKLFLIVDRHKFPQTLGPFNLVNVPLDASNFEMPEITGESRRAGFYWNMCPKVLEAYGLHSRTKRLIAQVSPMHPADDAPPSKEIVSKAQSPKSSSNFVWSYPVAGWEGVESDAYAMETWEEGLQGGAAVKSFLSVGGFMYFDSVGRVSSITTLGRAQDGDIGNLHFAEPKRWLPEWSAALAETGRFQKITIKNLRETGVRMYLWIRPEEVIECEDGNPLPIQPEAPHGAFVYLFHSDVLSTDEAATALDRYFAVTLTPSSSGIADDDGLFHALALVDGDRYAGSINGPQVDCETFCQGDDDEDSDGEDMGAASFLMSTPATISMGHMPGTPSTAISSSPLDLRSPLWPMGRGHAVLPASPPQLPFHTSMQQRGA